jgi:hypothetical protein
MKILAKIKNIKVGTFGAKSKVCFCFYFTKKKHQLIGKTRVFEKDESRNFTECVFTYDGNFYLREWIKFIKIIEN